MEGKVWANYAQTLKKVLNALSSDTESFAHTFSPSIHQRGYNSLSKQTVTLAISTVKVHALALLMWIGSLCWTSVRSWKFNSAAHSCDMMKRCVSFSLLLHVLMLWVWNISFCRGGYFAISSHTHTHTIVVSGALVFVRVLIKEEKKK